MSITRNFTATYVDSWNTGSDLYMTEYDEEESSDDEDHANEDSFGVEFTLLNEEYHVFHLLSYIGYSET